jgi:ArsR family transcriptional regulator
MRGPNVYTEDERLKITSEWFKVLGDFTRLRICSLLKVRSLCVCELVELLNVSQPAVSQHLRRLKSTQIVKEERKGQWIYYSLNMDDEKLKYVMELFPNLQTEINAFDRSGKKVICE